MKVHVMPRVLYCNASECAYNESQKCHAGAVTIDGPEPMCDTFFNNSRKGGVESTGTVGACKNNACIHNEDYECSANGIRVALHSNQPECETFTPKSEDV